MKKVLIVIGSSALVVAVLLIGLALVDRTAPPDKGQVSCPVYFGGALDNVIPKDHVASQWQIYRFDGEKGTADVKASVATVSTNTRPYSCQLAIARAPETPSKGADWRIGHVVKPDGFRGKTVRYRVAIKADREMKFDTGQIYVYDGFKVLGAATTQVTPEWRMFEAIISVDPAATTFEAWFRLLLDKGTVQPGSGTLYFVPEVEVQGG